MNDLREAIRKVRMGNPQAPAFRALVADALEEVARALEKANSTVSTQPKKSKVGPLRGSAKE